MTITLEEQKANRKVWIAGLRSNEFNQGKNYLENTKGALCCLGVLAKLAGCNREINGENVEFNGNSSSAPIAAMEWVGLTTSTGDYSRNRSLIGDNDLEGLTFNQIADIIESEPKGLFKDE